MNTKPLVENEDAKFKINDSWSVQWSPLANNQYMGHRNQVIDTGLASGPENME